MADPQVYDRFFVYLNGALQGQADTCNIEWQGSPLPVATFVNDFAGVTPVPKMVRITVEEFTPTAGLEFDAPKVFVKTQNVKVRCTFGGSGKAAVFSGFVDAPSIRSSATDNTKLTFTIMANASVFT